MPLYFNERPPYLVAGADGEVSGLTATPAANAFRAAGVAFRWVRLPTNRQIATLKENEFAACAVGWFKNAEREKFARYTKAVYQDRPTVALANVQFTPASLRLAELLRSPGTAVLVKDGFSYGAYIDDLMMHAGAVRSSTTVENAQMVKMIAAHRVDFMFVSEEEASYFAQMAGPGADRLKVLRFDDVPQGEKRYIMCSKMVSDETIARLNRAIAFE